MPIPRLLALAVLAASLTAAPAGRADEAGPAVPVEALAAAIGAWIAAELGLEAAPPPPEIRRAPPERLAALREGDAGAAPAGVLALYEPATGRIHLRSDWAGSDVAEVSVLVHEMVHHVQQVTGRSFACPGAAEAEAYALQARWLALFGESLAVLGVDPLFVRLLGACGF